ncbi:MAG: hypothetical protein IH787_03665 [Nitrospirae bacterium]|nr:hypothetical protein [Nitrospirota bacterium]
MADSKEKSEEKIEYQLKQIIERLDAIEKEMQRKGGSDEDGSSENALMQCCGLPMVPIRELEAGIDPGRESLIRSIEKKWVNGTELKYYLFDGGAWGGSDGQQRIVKDAFDEWDALGIGLSFTQVNSAGQADIRIGFKRGDGSWSYVGRDIWSRPVGERTMNFGWTLSGQDGRETALHEIGHTLGFHHEQQNPFAGIEWDDEAVYRYFTGPPNNWSRQKTFHNVLRTLDPNSVEGSEWDPDSIMQYAIRAGLIIRPEEYSDGLNPEPGLSDIDKARVRLFYPEIDQDLDELKRFRAERLNLEPADQANFVIKPQSTRRYQIQTFGSSDTVMVLFEDNNGTLEHFAADDDSGWSRNASLNVRLVRGRNYVLRIRLYFKRDSGETAVMLW